LVRGREGLFAVSVSRRVDAETVAQPRRDPWLIQGDPKPHLVRKRLIDYSDVFGEALARLPAGPAAAIFERLRQIPMVERENRLDKAFSQAIDQRL
jgi:hypothetical protein